MAFGFNNSAEKEIKKRIKELEKKGYPHDKAEKKARNEQERKAEKIMREDAREEKIQEIMEKRFCTHAEADKLLSKNEASENEKRAKEGIRSLEMAAKKFDDVAAKMDMQATKIREEARKAALQGMDKICRSHIAMVARMRSFGQTFMGISSRLTACALQLEAFQTIATLPGIIREINGVMNLCGGLDEYAMADIRSLGEFMSNIDNMIFGIEEMFDDDIFFKTESNVNENLRSIVDEELADVVHYAQVNGGVGNPIAEGKSDFANTDDILKIIDENK